MDDVFIKEVVDDSEMDVVNGSELMVLDGIVGMDD